MKDDFTEILDFNVEEVRSVGRPKLADKNTKKKSIIIASISFIFVILLLIFGYGTLFGFKNLNLKGAISKNEYKGTVYVEEIKPLVKDITLKSGTARKIYLSVLPASATNKDIEYVSSNEDVAIVDSEGKVTGVSAGKAIITATTTDGTSLSADFNIKVVKNASGKCDITSLYETSKGLAYTSECNNATIKEIQYKVGNDNYQKLLTKKTSDEIKFSNQQLKKKVTLKLIYYANNSKVSKYTTKSFSKVKSVTTTPKGSCMLEIKDVKSNQARYNISCKNASVTKIAYKIGNGSYVGIDSSSLADTVIFEESDVTRVIYFNVEYQIDGTNRRNTITKSSVIEKRMLVIVPEENEEGE